MSLDRSQSAGVHEKQILASWANNAFGNSIAIGTSSVHNAISHLKIVIVDGVYTVKGSTNWSLSGEQEQDNELTLSRNAVVAAETRAILDLNHDFMLKQMGGSGLNTKALMAPTTGAGCHRCRRRRPALPGVIPPAPAGRPLRPAGSGPVPSAVSAPTRGRHRGSAAEHPGQLGQAVRGHQALQRGRLAGRASGPHSSGRRMNTGRRPSAAAARRSDGCAATIPASGGSHSSSRSASNRPSHPA